MQAAADNSVLGLSVAAAIVLLDDAAAASPDHKVALLLMRAGASPSPAWLRSMRAAAAAFDVMFTDLRAGVLTASNPCTFDFHSSSSL